MFILLESFKIKQAQPIARPSKMIACELKKHTRPANSDECRLAEISVPFPRFPVTKSLTALPCRGADVCGGSFRWCRCDQSPATLCDPYRGQEIMAADSTRLKIPPSF